MCSEGVCAAAQTSQAAALPLPTPLSTALLVPKRGPWRRKLAQGISRTWPRRSDLRTCRPGTGLPRARQTQRLVESERGNVCTVPQVVLVTPLLCSSLDNRLHFICSLQVYKIHREGPPEPQLGHTTLETCPSGTRRRGEGSSVSAPSQPLPTAP